MRSLRVGVVVILALGFSSGCSLTSGLGRSDSTPPPAASELDALKKHILELEQRAAMAEVEIKRLRRRIDELESGRSSAAPGMREPARSPGIAPPPLAEAPVTDSEVEVSDLPVAPEMTPRTASGVPAPPPAETPKADAALAPADDGTLSASAQALYDRGYTLYHQGRYVDSETAFQQFIRRHGATVLGDNAQFWIGEARYARGDTRGALAAFRETVARFPEGNKAPDALVKVGDCLEDLGDSQGAEASWREVLAEFPSSPAAAVASERLSGSG